MELSSTIWCTVENRRHHTEFIRRTTLRSCAWRKTDGRIPSEDQCQTRLHTLAFPLLFGCFPEYEDIRISGEARNTMDS